MISWCKTSSSFILLCWGQTQGVNVALATHHVHTAKTRNMAMKLLPKHYLSWLPITFQTASNFLLMLCSPHLPPCPGSDLHFHLSKHEVHYLIFLSACVSISQICLFCSPLLEYHSPLLFPFWLSGNSSTRKVSTTPPRWLPDSPVSLFANRCLLCEAMCFRAWLPG